MPVNLAKREIILLILALDGAHEIDSPEIFIAGGKAQLVVGNTHFHSPTQVVDLGRTLPDSIPGTVVPFVIIQRLVDDRAGWIDTELITAALVEIGVDREAEPVGIEHIIAAAEQTDDLSRLGIVQSGSHV
jgi:hypothetical protein